MDLNELFFESQLNEFELPYSRTQAAKDSIVGGIKGLVGGGQKEQGNASTGEMANQYYNDFKYYVGTQGLNGKKYIEAQVLIDWMNSKGFDTSVVSKEPSDMISPKEAASFILLASRKKKRLGANQMQQKPQDKTQATVSSPINQKEQEPTSEKPQVQQVPQQVSNSILKVINSLSSPDRDTLIKYLKS